jgi:membrane-bound ClpP family serine protease
MLTTLAALLKPAALRVGIVLSLLGLVLLVIAAYRVNLTVGLAATGVACFLFEARLDLEKAQREADRNASRG